MDKAKVFVITPFGEEFLALYEHMKTTFSDNFEFTNAGDLENQQNILKDIVVGIDTADVIIADLTGLNPNVFYELGLAHTMNKKVIIITQDLSELPFDIKSYRANEYSMQFYKLQQLIEKLTDLLNGAVRGTTQFGNPVFDYSSNFKNMLKSQITLAANTAMIEVGIPKKVGEYDDTTCILDNLVEVEESIREIESMTIGIAEDMKEMTTELEKATNEIDRVKKTGGGSVNTFARNIARKVSVAINAFAANLENYNEQTNKKWDSVENNLLMYFDAMPKAKTSETISFYNEIEALYSTLDANSTSMVAFLQSLQGTKGFERRLNTATNKLEVGVNGYLNLLEKMKSSIDRILSKLDTLTDLDSREDD